VKFLFLIRGRRLFLRALGRGRIEYSPHCTIHSCIELYCENIYKANLINRRVPSSGTLRRVALVKPTSRRNVSPPSSGWQESVT
jgi:hypothetical protein